MDCPHSVVLVVVTWLLLDCDVTEGSDWSGGIRVPQVGDTDQARQRLHSPTEARLKDRLINRYPYLKQQSKPRPVVDPTKAINVSFGIHLIQILDFGQKEQKLTSQLWKNFKWQDEFLHWDPDDFDDIKTIHVNSDLIWTPDIILYNVFGNARDTDREVQLLISHTGDVLWIPPTITHTSCQIDLTNFPFDTQVCRLEFGSWIYSMKEMNIDIGQGDESLNLNRFTDNMEWTVTKVGTLRQEILYDCCEDNFYLITYTLHLQRNSGYYTRVMLLPVMLLSVIAVFIFCVPAHRPDRTSLGLSLFTSFMLLLLLVVDISPPSVTSKLSIYLSACVCIVTSAIVLSIVLINIATWRGSVPSWIRVVFLESLARCLFPFVKHPMKNNQNHSETKNKKSKWKNPDYYNDVAPRASSSNDSGATPSNSLVVWSEESYSTVTSAPRKATSEWTMLVSVLDRLLFILYAIVLSACVLLYFPNALWST